MTGTRAKKSKETAHAEAAAKKNGANEVDCDSEDSVPLKKLFARKKWGKGTPATKVTMGRRNKKTTPTHSTPPKEANNLDFEEELEEETTKVVGTPSSKKATTNAKKKKAKDKEKKPKASKEGDNGKEEEKSKGKVDETKETASPTTNDSTSSAGEEKHNEDDDLAACCLCHCALDYSDRSAFFEADRKQEIENKSSGSEEEPLYFQPTDPYLPPNLYDPSNALVYCDTCDRLYHQKCHFVPLMVVPRGKWSCLVCTTKDSLTEGKNAGGRGRKKNKDTARNTTKDAPAAPFTKHKLSRMFKTPLPPTKLQQYLTEGGEDHHHNKKYHTSAENEWEIATGRHKAILWNKTLTQTVPSWIQSQMSNINQARTALETLTQTKQNRQHFLENNGSKRGSQELAQTLVKLAGTKWKMRQMVLNLEEIRANPERHIQLMKQWCGQGGTTSTMATATTTLARAAPPKSFLERVIFPFGQYPHRAIPRTPEMQEELEAEKKRQNAEKESGIPNEIVTTTTTTTAESAKGKNKKGASKNNQSKRTSHKAHHHCKNKPPRTTNDDGSSSSGVSLDNLVCAICMIGDASDENDLLLCDAQGCFRAYHMQCLEPIMTLQDVEGTEDEDWFCPLCSGMAQCVHQIQSYYMGEEWDRRRLDRAAAKAAAAAKGKKKKGTEEQHEEEDADDDDSLKSWEKPGDVFPESKWEYETALMLKAGKRTKETDALIRDALDEGDEEHEVNMLDYISDGTDDPDIDAHFDLEAFHEERKREYEEVDEDCSEDDDSSHSSQATLVDMSSVELKIGKDELNALDEGSRSDSNSDDDDSGSGSDDGSGGSDSGGEEPRRSRRLRKQQELADLPKNVGVEFDPNNIVQGKRRRKPVDYRKLNDVLFGDMNAKDLAKIDDKEDEFQVQVPKKKVCYSSGDEGSGSDDENDNDENENKESDVEQSHENGKEKSTKKKNKKKNGKKAKRPRKRSRTSSDDDISSGNEAENDDSSVESNGDKKKKAAKKPPTKKKRRVSSNTKKTASVPGTKTQKNGTKPSNKVNGKKDTKKQTDKKAASTQKKQNGAKTSGSKATKVKESKAKASKVKAATKSRKSKAD